MSEIPEKQIKRLSTLIREAETSIAAANELLRSYVGDNPEDKPVINASESAGKVIEGVFNGQHMIGPDGKTYPVPANYASKSKLIQGDILKLTITEDGSFIYKQIGPAPRQQLMGALGHDVNGYFVESEGTTYKVLLASVTYFKCRPGDTVSIIVPSESDDEVTWAAIEAVV